MRVIAVSMVKNEADIIETCVRHIAAHVDHVVVSDNGSTDGTRELLQALPCEVIDDPDPAYYQSRKMTALAHYAREHLGADWIVPFDADEIWAPLTGQRIADVLKSADGFQVAPAWLYDHVVTDADPTGVAPQRAMGHRTTERARLHKVAARAYPGMVIEMGNHQVTYPHRIPNVLWGALEVRHFPIRTPEQYLRKARQGAAALALTDLPESTGLHWRDWDRLADQQGNLNDAFLDHWYYRAGDPRITYDPAPVLA